ncbi:hypothetical protein Scep_021512 [Stephania cephalantha]|uniref:Uncharacterized protein n=1 Tax=Stephania cephalantha TaxID=152367 RepID=A0AAP0HWX1_9MAGN
MARQWRKRVEVAERARGEVAGVSTVAGEGIRDGGARERRGGWRGSGGGDQWRWRCEGKARWLTRRQWCRRGVEEASRGSGEAEGRDSGLSKAEVDMTCGRGW